MIILSKNSFVNLIALSRLIPILNIKEQHCKDVNVEKFKDLQKDIISHTILYYVVFVLSLLAAWFAVTPLLSTVGLLIAVFMLSMSVWAKYKFLTGRLKVDGRKTYRDPILEAKKSFNSRP